MQNEDITAYYKRDYSYGNKKYVIEIKSSVTPLKKTVENVGFHTQVQITGPDTKSMYYPALIYQDEVKDYFSHYKKHFGEIMGLPALPWYWKPVQFFRNL